MERGKLPKGSKNVKIGDGSISTVVSEISSPKYCGCGIRVRICTSSQGKTVGRKFYGCSNYGTQSFCGFFQWIDSINMLEDGENCPGMLKLKNTEIELQMMKDKAHDLEAQVAKMTKKKVKLKNDLKCLKEEIRILETREKWLILVTGVFFVLFFSMLKNMF